VLSVGSVHSVTFFRREAPTMNTGRALRVEH
jgi:hypothetical protein